MQTRMKEETQAMFEKSPNTCMTLINNEWFIEPRQHHLKLSKKLISTNLKEE